MRCIAFSSAVLTLLVSAATGSELDLDVDSDRSGAIDGTPAEDAIESAQSAILLNNCDRESAAISFEPDNADDRVNGSTDLHDIEPIVIRQYSDPVTSVSLKLKEHSNDSIPLSQRVRVFGLNGREILGPTKGVLATLTASDLAQLHDGDITIYVEGINFATSVILEVEVDGVMHDSVLLEVAPLIFTPHSMPALENYVSLTGSPASHSYVNAFKAACGQASVNPVVVETVDRWVEDELTWAYTESPRKRLDVAFHMFRGGLLKAKVKALLGPDVGWGQAFHYDGVPVPRTSLTFGGNVEVSPPTLTHPFGRVYYGSITTPDDLQNTYNKRKFPPEFRDFFLRNCAALQPSIDLDTNWLAVGHIDEIISFVPKADGSGCVMLISSPKLAYDILKSIPRTTLLDPKYSITFGYHTVEDLFVKGTLNQTTEDYNMEVDRRIFGTDHATPSIDSIKGIMMTELGLNESDIVEVPTVFYNHEDPDGDPDEWAGIALTPGVVNLSSMGVYSLVPTPFLNEFQSQTENAIGADGRKVLWIDNWVMYHAYMGEVHCGSQERRSGFSQKWWE